MTSGQFRSSLHGFLHVPLAKGRIQRVLIPAFGGAAVSAARLHDAATVDALAAAMAEFLTHGRLEYELADMTREFSRKPTRIWAPASARPNISKTHTSPVHGAAWFFGGLSTVSNRSRSRRRQRNRRKSC